VRRRQLSYCSWHLSTWLVKSPRQFGSKAVVAAASIFLLLAIAEARIARPEALHAQPQFSRASAVAASAYTLVDGFDLALLTRAPVFNFPAPSLRLIRVTRPHYQSRLKDFPYHVRPPPAAWPCHLRTSIVS
jgi:uncharacterized MnhB-related membrane protein